MIIVIIIMPRVSSNLIKKGPDKLPIKWRNVSKKIIFFYGMDKRFSPRIIGKNAVLIGQSPI